MIRPRFTARRGARAAVTTVMSAAALAALTAACGSSGSSSSAPAATGAAAGHATATTSPTTGGPTTGKLTGAAATALVAKALANTRAAASVRVAGQVTATGTGSAGGSQPVSFDLTLVKSAGCQGTLALSKTQSFQIVETGGYVWILPSSAYYQSLHIDKTALALIAGKYIKVKSTDSQIGNLGKECTFDGLLGSVSKPTGKNYAAVPVTYAGAPAYEVTQSGNRGTAFISNTATPLLLKLTDPQAASGAVTFTDYNVTKTITAPPAAESIDGSQLGL